MADTSYLCVAGVEVANACRTVTYAQAGLRPHTMAVRPCCCGDLAPILGDDPYTLPADDDAPWYDPAEPDSADFAGLLVTGIEGLDSAPVQRAVTDRIGDGAVIGRRRYGPRTITVTGVLLGRTSCAADYGLRWLASTLQGSLGCGAGSCGGDDLEFMTCCPSVDAGGCCAGACTAQSCAEGVFRTLRDVALAEGPTVLRRIGGGCGCCPGTALEVQFTLMAGRPHALRPAITVAEAVAWPPAEDDPDECIEWVTDPACMSEDAECAARQPMPCPLDPDCAAPTLPELPMPTNPCVCEPWERREVCVTIPPATAPIWADMVPLLEIYAGSDVLRNIRVRFYANPGSVPASELDVCSWCSEVNISFLPEFAQLVLDSTRRTVMVQCPGRAETPASEIVSGPDGGPFQWPTLECGIPYTVCISADSTTIADDATVTLRAIVREV